ncbi:MAG: TIGR03936 family radical SAM-associated protein [Spirochaetia bacterium]
MAAASSRDLRALLQRVEKPGRYVGGEFGGIKKPDAGLTVAISYPDLYEIGMSNSAVKILYSLLNSIPDVSCERVFAPAPDFEAALQAAGMPLFSLESRRPLSKFDVIGFSFGYELTLTNLLAILDASGISLRSSARGPGEPVVLVGGPAATNPAPLGLFADAVFIGEAEGWAPACFSEMARMKRRGAGRADIVAYLRLQPSIWHPGKAAQVRRAFWRGFSRSGAETGFPVPNIRVVQDHGAVEIMRGCPNACRFCHATVLYRPCRVKRAEIIREEVRKLVDHAGYRQISLSSLSSGDFQEIHGLVRDLNALYAPRMVSFSLPSLRVDSLGLGLLHEISEVRKSGLTFAVETALPEWQREVRKSVSLDKVIALLKEAKGLGWKAAKFYFMVGLPPSFDNDESGTIIDFLRAVRETTRMSLNVNVAAFIPKPHTPWQRSPQIGEEEAMARIMAVRKGFAGDGFKIGYHAPILSLLEGIVARGDEKAGLLVLDAYHRGARLDAWEEHVRLDVWRRAIAEADWDVLGETCRPRARDEALPWERIMLGLTSSEIGDAPLPLSDASSRPAAPTAAPGTQISKGWERLVFSFSKTSTAAFISHLDLMTVFERSFARAGYAARFTEGYNPKPRLEFANPLSLGLCSDQEIAGIDLHNFDSADSFVSRLNASLPEGLRVFRAALIPQTGTERRRSLMSLYWGADFEVSEESGRTYTLRLPASGPSIRKTMEAAGTWETAQARRIATWASGAAGKPEDYFDVLRASIGGSDGDSPSASKGVS